MQTEPGVQSTQLAPSGVTNLQALSSAFADHCKNAMNIDVPGDFLEVAACAVARLKLAQRSNAVYNLAKGLGTKHPDRNGSRFPVTRMPMGLVEYVTNFFVAEDISTVSVY